MVLNGPQHQACGELTDHLRACRAAGELAKQRGDAEEHAELDEQDQELLATDREKGSS